MRKGAPDIRVVTAADLSTLEPLFRASFGRGDFELQDELEAFAASNPKNWFALYDGLPQGLIRYFPISKNLYAGELYVVPDPERARRLEHLLRHFVRHHKLLAAATLRLDVLQTDAELTNALGSLFPAARTKTFAHYQLKTPARVPKVALYPLTKTDLETTQAVLAQLKRYSLRELEHLAQTEQLYAYKDNGVKAALHAAPDGHAGLEVVTLATAPSYLRRGYAAALLKTFLDANPDTSVVLKVNVENTAAISLYEHNGFTRQNDLTEVWWYLPL